MKELIVAVVVAALGSGALFGFIQFLIIRHDNKKGAVMQDLSKLQIMLLIADYSDKVDEILKLAEHYFCDLDGDTYITALFKDWLKDKKISYPDWFIEHLKKKKEPIDG